MTANKMQRLVTEVSYFPKAASVSLPLDFDFSNFPALIIRTLDFLALVPQQLCPCALLVEQV